MDAITNLRYPGGTTDTTGGLHMMRTQMFNVAGDRPFVNNTAIIITDGRPTVMETVPAEMEAVHDAQITTYAVGVTSQVDETTLQLLCSPPQQVSMAFRVRTKSI